MIAAQKLLLDVIRASSFNSLDGEAVYNDLFLHVKEWKVVIPTCAFGVGIPARHLMEGHTTLSFDTIYIITNERNTAFWEDFAKKHVADEVDWLKGEKLDQFLGVYSVNDSVPVLRLWWD